MINWLITKLIIWIFNRYVENVKVSEDENDIIITLKTGYRLFAHVEKKWYSKFKNNEQNARK